MIPAGRSAVDIGGIAALHGLTPSQARRRRPWAQPGHPAPLTTGPARRGHPQLWDAEQAAAYARGEPVPALPAAGHPHDLLDSDEAAERAGLDPATWYGYLWREEQRRAARQPGEVELAPRPDDEVCGVAHWYRATIDRYREERAARAGQGHGGRPSGTPEKHPRGTIAARVHELLADAAHSGQTLSVAELARRLDISYSTALKHAKSYRVENPST